MQILENLQRQRQSTFAIPTELEQLEQGDIPVAQYVRKFTRLFDCIDSEVTMIKWFVKGLKSSVQADFISVNPQTFDDAIRRAFLVRSGTENRMKTRKQDITQPTTSAKDDKSKKQRMKARKGIQHKKVLSCDFCGKKNRTQMCDRRRGVCFRCGPLEQFIKNCPRKKNVSTSTTSLLKTIPTTNSLEIPINK